MILLISLLIFFSIAIFLLIKKYKRMYRIYVYKGKQGMGMHFSSIYSFSYKEC